MTELSIAQLARTARVTSRTLRHYDSLGLLRPSRTTSDGRRYYDDDALVRLHHILVLKELGMALADIGSVVNTSDHDEVVRLLVRHREAVIIQRDRLAGIADAVTATINSLEKGLPMSPDRMFAAFSKPEYEAEARERYGDEAVDHAHARLAASGPLGQEALMAEATVIGHALAALAASGEDPASAKVQDCIARHYEWVSRSWTPDADGYLGLAHTYLEDERFFSYYEGFGPGTAALLSRGMKTYAVQSLSS